MPMAFGTVSNTTIPNQDLIDKGNVDIGTKLRAPFSSGLLLDSALSRAFGTVSNTTVIPYQDLFDKGNVDGTKLAMAMLSRNVLLGFVREEDYIEREHCTLR